MSVPLPVQLVLGDPQHGVTRYAAQLAGWLRAEAVRDVASVPPGAAVHLHLTDRLLGPGPDRLLRVVDRLARRHRLTVTLHDVPQPTDGAAAFDRRVGVYRAVVARASGWVTSSEHEQALVARWCRPPAPGAVVPLPVVRTGASAPTAAVVPGTVGVFGFVYPGKGHRTVLDALGLLRRRGVAARMLVLGGPAPGHEEELAGLETRAEGLGVPLELTGHLPDPEVLTALRSVAVPVVGHRNVSASGSLNSWLAAGRRPLVRSGTYAVEMARLRPGTSTLFAGGRLVGAVADALADPAGTWLPDDADLRPGPAETVAAYRDWWWSTAPTTDAVPA